MDDVRPAGRNAAFSFACSWADKKGALKMRRAETTISSMLFIGIPKSGLALPDEIKCPIRRQLSIRTLGLPALKQGRNEQAKVFGQKPVAEGRDQVSVAYRRGP